MGSFKPINVTNGRGAGDVPPGGAIPSWIVDMPISDDSVGLYVRLCAYLFTGTQFDFGREASVNNTDEESVFDLLCELIAVGAADIIENPRSIQVNLSKPADDFVYPEPECEPDSETCWCGGEFCGAESELPL